MNTDTKALCLRYFLLNLNSTEISKLTGYSPRTVQGFMQANDWQSLKSANIQTDVLQVWKMYSKGTKPKQIAVHFARSVRWVHDKLYKARKVKETPTMAQIDRYYPLFNHMANEHGVLLLESELQEIENLVLEMKKGQS